jgi:hypothetical protein
MAFFPQWSAVIMINRELKKITQKSAELYPGSFPQGDSESPLDDGGGYDDPHSPVEDDRPEFVKADEEGWDSLPGRPPRH